MKKKTQVFTNDELREMILQFFYDRASKATSLRGKKGSSLKMKDVKAGLKALYGLNDSQIISNLTYLISQGWIDEVIEKKSFTTPTGAVVPSETHYYSITAAGTDRIEGPGRFTPKRFSGINIEAVESIITIGDGNQINVKYKEAAQTLSELRNQISKSTEINDDAKLDLVTDIDSIQDQLAKPNPNKSVIKTLWYNVEKSAAIASLAEYIAKAAPFIFSLIS